MNKSFFVFLAPNEMKIKEKSAYNVEEITTTLSKENLLESLDNPVTRLTEFCCLTYSSGSGGGSSSGKYELHAREVYNKIRKI